jgi:competence protein ComEA
MTLTEPDRRLDRWTSWLQATPAELVGLSVLLLGGLAVAGVLWWQSAHRPSELPPDVAASGVDLDATPGAVGVGDEVGAGTQAHDGQDPSGDPPGDPPGDHGVIGEVAAAPTGEVVVHVSGAVTRPGLVTLPAGARVGDAVDAVGGATGDADPERVNLARPLQDGEHLHLPRQGEELPAGYETGDGAGHPGGTADATGGGGTTSDGRIDLNRASAAELEALPGIGPAKAAAIVGHRDEHGPFGEPGDLRAVTGIGEKTFQGLADLVVAVP